MKNVQISTEGIIRNILSLNYTILTMVMEYINNVISKNSDENYKIQFTLKRKRGAYEFIFREESAVGFESLEQINKAFSIANSERNGANNMGYGIYSPITVYKDYDSFNLFIQNNDNGSFYSVSRFNPETNQIITSQGEIRHNKIAGVKINELIPDNGTISIWISAHVDDDFNTEETIVKYIKKQHLKFGNIDIISDDETLQDIKEIGKRYVDYMDNIPIYYGSSRIEPINIINKDNLVEYRISIQHDSEGKIKFRIKENLDNPFWNHFNKCSRKPIGETIHRDLRCEEQTAEFRITDMGIPRTTAEKFSNQRDKAIWVKLNDIKIFNESFVMNSWPNIRAELVLHNDGDNNFDKFISPNPNKSNSKINSDIKEYLVNLIKYSANNKLSNCPSSGRKSIPKKIKIEVWEKYFENCCRHNCFIDECNNEITAWDFQAGHDIPYSEQGSDDVENLRPICGECNKGMGDKFSIDEWNEKLKSYH